MAVITISRGSFSGGKILAECLSKRLGYRCIDRDVIVEKAAAYGVSQRDIREALETGPRFLERFKHRRYLYLALVQAALTEEVREGGAIYHGLAGHLLLKGGEPILRVRIIAPMDMRIQMLQQRLKYSRSEAVAHIEKVDEERRKWTQFLYGVNWGDPSQYDLVLNLEHISIEKACCMLGSLVTNGCFRSTAECQQRMDDLALASRIRANLAIHPWTSELELDVSSHVGAVQIRGKLSLLEQLEQVKRIAEAAHGVVSVDISGLAPPVRV